VPLVVVLSAPFIGGIGAATSITSSPAVLLALASLTAAALLLVRVVFRRVFPPTADGANARSIRRRAERTPFLRLRDPGAAGRPRPRAPTPSPRTA